jgi:5-methylcytosine-specific restriction endonuclease McrA
MVSIRVDRATGADLTLYVDTVPRGRPDIANTALRIFLQEMGAAYDEGRGRATYKGGAHFTEIKEFFGGRCCYCGAEFGPTLSAVQDHLIPMNKADLGLHAWGNIVPACQACNAKKQRHDWRDFIIERAGPDAGERHARVKAFLVHYHYEPSFELRDVAEELYEEVGSIAMTLIGAKIKRVRDKL